MAELLEQSQGMIHATAVRDCRSAALIIGASGSGKSSLALQLMAFGAGLICDDLVSIEVEDGCLTAKAPPSAISGIEARGMGVLSTTLASSASLKLVVDLDTLELERLPPARFINLGGHRIPVVRKVDSPAFPSMVWQRLTHM